MKSDKRVKVGISIGDLDGEGGALVLKTFENSLILDFCVPVIFANKRFLTALKKQLNLKLHLQQINKVTEAMEGRVNVMNVWKEQAEAGTEADEDTRTGYALLSLDAAVKALQSGAVNILLAAPQDFAPDKSGRHPSFSAYLAEELRSEPVNLKLGEEMRAGDLQDCLEIDNGQVKFHPDLFDKKIKDIESILLRAFRITKPKIAVVNTRDEMLAGLEPLKKAISRHNDKGLLIYGIYGGKKFFSTQNYRYFDVVLLLDDSYSVIAPDFVSLPVDCWWVQDHVVISSGRSGAKVITGTDTADQLSFHQALYQGIDAYRRTEEYKIISANPLKSHSLKREKEFD